MDPSHWQMSLWWDASDTNSSERLRLVLRCGVWEGEQERCFPVECGHNMLPWKGKACKEHQERRVLEKTKEGQFEDTVNHPVQSSSETKSKVSLGLLSKEVTSDLGDDCFWLISTLLYFFPPGCHIDRVGPNIVEDNVDFSDPPTSTTQMLGSKVFIAMLVSMV